MTRRVEYQPRDTTPAAVGKVKWAETPAQPPDRSWTDVPQLREELRAYHDQVLYDLMRCRAMIAAAEAVRVEYARREFGGAR